MPRFFPILLDSQRRIRSIARAHPNFLFYLVNVVYVQKCSTQVKKNGSVLYVKQSKFCAPGCHWMCYYFLSD